MHTSSKGPRSCWRCGSPGSSPRSRSRTRARGPATSAPYPGLRTAGVGSERGEAAAGAALPSGDGRRGGRVPEWPGCGGALGGDGGRADGRQVPGWPSVGAGLPRCWPPSRSAGDSLGICPLGVTFRRPPETPGKGGSPRAGRREVAVLGTEAIPRRHLVQPRAVPAGNMWRRRSGERSRACATQARSAAGGAGAVSQCCWRPGHGSGAHPSAAARPAPTASFGMRRLGKSLPVPYCGERGLRNLPSS